MMTKENKLFIVFLILVSEIKKLKTVSLSVHITGKKPLLVQYLTEKT